MNNDASAMEDILESMTPEQREEWENIQKMFQEMVGICEKYAADGMGARAMTTSTGQLLSILLHSYSKEDAHEVLESFYNTAKRTIR